MKEFRTYIYDGPVMLFENCVASRWRGKTIAISEKRAKSNLAYQYKKANNMTAGSKIELPGKILVEA